MPLSLSVAGRLITALVFAAALSVGIGQVLAATGTQPCDTAPGTCEINDDCFDACFEEGGWTNGGECMLPEGCCLCLL